MIVDSHIQGACNSGLFIGMFIDVALPPTGLETYSGKFFIPLR
jgi:hypothetical protein